MIQNISLIRAYRNADDAGNGAAAIEDLRHAPCADREFYERRSRQELELARGATSTSARQIHLELALRYRERLLDNRRVAIAPPERGPT